MSGTKLISGKLPHTEQYLADNPPPDALVRAIAAKYLLLAVQAQCATLGLPTPEVVS